MAGKTPLLDVLSSNLRRLMYEQHLTQQELGDRAKVQRSAVSLILSGTDLRISTLEKLANALGVEAGYLLMPNITDAAITQNHVDTRADLAAAMSVILAEIAKGKR